jgi:UDP-N-acetylmuramoylalanine--D-glutamate ligase
VVFGEAADEIAADIGAEGVAYERAAGLAEAVTRSAHTAAPGVAVILSPACASFDEFADYADRGRTFRGLVEALAGEVA